MSTSPALLMSSSTPAEPDRSAVTTSTVVPCEVVSSSARASSSVRLLAHITKSQSCAASTLAISRPIPLDAPVTKALSRFMLELMGNRILCSLVCTPELPDSRGSKPNQRVGTDSLRDAVSSASGHRQRRLRPCGPHRARCHRAAARARAWRDPLESAPSSLLPQSSVGACRRC